MYTLEDLRRICSVQLHYSDHAEALRYFGTVMICEEGANTMHFHFSEFETVPTIIRRRPKLFRRHGGEPNDFHPRDRFSWHWWQMLANLRDVDLQTIVQGPQWRQNGGIIHCCVWPAVGDNVWVFRFTRDDGTQVWMKPNSSNPKVQWGEIYHGEQVRIEETRRRFDDLTFNSEKNEVKDKIRIQDTPMDY